MDHRGHFRLPKEDGEVVGLNFASPEDGESPDSEKSGEAFVRNLRRMIGTITANSTYREDDLWQMTLPQIEMRYEDVLRYSITTFGMVGDEDTKKVRNPEREHTVADALAFVRQFAGIGG